MAGEEGEGQRKATSGGRQRETRGLGLGAGEAGGGRCAGLGVDGSGAAHSQRQWRGQRTEPPIHGSRRAACRALSTLPSHGVYDIEYKGYRLCPWSSIVDLQLFYIVKIRYISRHM